jgi:hypothetical protein
MDRKGRGVRTELQYLGDAVSRVDRERRGVQTR